MKNQIKHYTFNRKVYIIIVLAFLVIIAMSCSSTYQVKEYKTPERDILEVREKRFKTIDKNGDIEWWFRWNKKNEAYLMAKLSS